MLEQAIREIQDAITSACERCGRAPESVTLIAVSKTKPLPLLEEAYQLGIRHFGENRVQEMCEKAQAFGDVPIIWHLIGHLQKNKVKRALSVASLIHSVDSLALAMEIDKEAAKIGRCQDILLEVNMAEEESKFGLTADNVLPMVQELAQLDHIRICGLMTVAPYTENPESNRTYFKKMKQLAVDIAAQNIDNVSMDILSMGMSGDYEVAIEEGATHVRVGTKLFGERNYN